MQIWLIVAACNWNDALARCSCQASSLRHAFPTILSAPMKDFAKTRWRPFDQSPAGLSKLAGGLLFMFRLR